MAPLPFGLNLTTGWLPLLVLTHAASEEDVRGLVGPEDFAKFLKFTLQKKSTDYRECPKEGCGTMILGK